MAGKLVIFPFLVIVGCKRCHTAPQKLHSKIFGSAVISSSGSSHSGQVLVGPRKILLKSDVFSVGMVRVGKCPHECRLEKSYKFVAKRISQTRNASLLAQEQPAYLSSLAAWRHAGILSSLL